MWCYNFDWIIGVYYYFIDELSLMYNGNSSIGIGSERDETPLRLYFAFQGIVATRITLRHSYHPLQLSRCWEDSRSKCFWWSLSRWYFITNTYTYCYCSMIVISWTQCLGKILCTCWSPTPVASTNHARTWGPRSNTGRRTNSEWSNQNGGGNWRLPSYWVWVRKAMLSFARCNMW